MIKTAIRLENGDVLVFDGEGEQIPGYQGQYEEVREAILRETALDAAFLHWFDCGAEPEAVPKAQW